MDALSLRVLAAAAGLTASPESVAAQSRNQVENLRQIGPALASCWRPLPGTQNFDVAVRLALKSDGHILGRPRITFSRFNGDGQEQREIIRSILLALVECTPLDLTPDLGGAIAGRMLVFRFRPSVRGA